MGKKGGSSSAGGKGGGKGDKGEKGGKGGKGGDKGDMKVRDACCPSLETPASYLLVDSYCLVYHACDNCACCVPRVELQPR